MNLDISVPPLLEFYYTRKLQASGLVVTAYPDVLGAGPGFDSFQSDDKKLVKVFSASEIKNEDKDRQLWTMIVGDVRAFAEGRRSDFGARGSIARIQRGGGPGQVFVYRMEIVGPALSECTRNRWEKLVLQVIPQPSADHVSLLFQFQEGFFAPGSQDRRPDDSRMQENRIPDGNLENLQGLLGGFLVQRGFFHFGNASINPDVGCKL